MPWFGAVDGCRAVFRIRIQLGRRIRIQTGQQLAPKKGTNEETRWKSLNVLCRVWEDISGGFGSRIVSNYKVFANFVIIYLCQDPDLDPVWSRIQHQAGSGSGSGFSEIPESGSGFTEYRSKKLVPGKVALVSVCVTRIKSRGGGRGGGGTNSFRLPNAASGVQFGHGYNFLYVVLLVLPKIGIDRCMARTEYWKWKKATLLITWYSTL